MSSVMRCLLVVVSWTILARSGATIPNYSGHALASGCRVGLRETGTQTLFEKSPRRRVPALIASHIRRGADRGVKLRDIEVLDPQRVELRRQLHEVFPVGAEDTLPARDHRCGLVERQLADIAWVRRIRDKGERSNRPLRR